MKKSVRGLLFALTLSTLAVGSSLTCPPVLSPDGVSVDPNCPGIGAQVFALPNTSWVLDFNDNKNKGDYDFNDLMAVVAFNATGNQAIVTWAGSASGMNNALYYGFTEIFTDMNHAAPVTITTSPNLEVVFGLFVPDSPSQFYFDGPAIRNPDHQAHAYVAQLTPEPSTWGAILMGLAGVLLCKALQKKPRR